MPLNNEMREHNLNVVLNLASRTRRFILWQEETAISVANKLWESVSSWIDGGNLLFENETYNLRDSIAAGVYNNGVLKAAFLMENAAGQEKVFKYHGAFYNVDGIMRAAEALYKPYNHPGISIVFRCRLEYGFFVELGLGPASLADGGDTSKRGYGWWSNGLVPYIKKEFNRIINENRGNQ